MDCIIAVEKTVYVHTARSGKRVPVDGARSVVGVSVAKQVRSRAAGGPRCDEGTLIYSKFFN